MKERERNVKGIWIGAKENIHCTSNESEKLNHEKKKKSTAETIILHSLRIL